MKKTLIGAVICAASVVGLGTSALAGGPPRDVLEGNDNTWSCGPGETGGNLPDDNHCINNNSQGNTGLIIVLDDDDRWPAEGISLDDKADSRPCPHDPAADPDGVNGRGTWWSPGGAGTAPYVCHHKPTTPAGS